MQEFIYISIFAIYGGVTIALLDWNYKNSASKPTRVSKLIDVVALIMALSILIILGLVLIHLADIILRIHYAPPPPSLPRY